MLRRRLFLALALAATALVMALPATTASAQTLYVQDTDDGHLNLRKGPGTRHGIIMRLTAGTAVELTGREGNWRQVILPDGTRGWVHRRYLALQYVSTLPYAFMVDRTSDGYLNLRRGPGTRFGVIRRLHAGQMLLRAGPGEGRWAQVELPDGTAGWVSTRYLVAVD